MDIAERTGQDDNLSIKGLMVLSRLPFLSPGLASLVTGILIAIAWDYDPEYGLVWMSIVGLALIMLATYYFNEYFDYEGDIINRTFIKFSGGSRALPDKMVPRSVARIAGWSSVGILVIIAMTYLIFYFDDYPWLLPMALFGAFCGVFYSHPPFQLAYRGIGEILIGFCYGILAMISGFYIVSGVIEAKMVLLGLPASLSIFSVIVANEFPDIEADKAVSKKNLVVLLGLERASKMYMIAMMLVYPMMVASAAVGISIWIVVFGLPVLLICAIAIGSTTSGGYAKPRSQMRISGATLFGNLLSSLMFIPVVNMW